MERISQTDIRAILDLLRRLGEVEDLDAFPRRVLPLLHEIIPSDMITFNEVNPDRGRISVVVDPPGSLPADGQQRFEPYIGEHPLIGHYHTTGDGQALKISDFFSQRQLHQLGLYQDFFGRVGVEHQIAVTLPSPAPLVVGIALNRGHGDFSERDRLLLNLLRPHLVQVYRRAEAHPYIERALDALERGMEVAGYGLVVLGLGRGAPLMTAQARRWLATYLDWPNQGHAGLPEALQDWLDAQRQRSAKHGGIPQPFEPLCVRHPGSQLTVRFLEGTAGQPDLLLLREQRPTQTGTEAAEASLTSKEQQVLQLTVRGRTNVQIGSLLGISHRTVQKHLEHVYAKLGVEGRTAAAAWAFRHRGDDEPGADGS